MTPISVRFLRPIQTANDIACGRIVNPKIVESTTNRLVIDYDGELLDIPLTNCVLVYQPAPATPDPKPKAPSGGNQSAKSRRAKRAQAKGSGKG